MKKTFTLIALVLVIVLLFAACGTSGGKTDGTTAEPETETPAPIETETEEITETEEETTEAPETIARPTADGQEVAAYDVSFYLPESLTANEWNGMLGVYDFYTGEYSGSYPTGMDIALSVTDESNANGDLGAYAREASAKLTATDIEPEEIDFNGTTWLRFKSGEIMTNYYTIFNGGLYEITTRAGGEAKENYDAAIAMLEETLFLAVSEE